MTLKEIKIKLCQFTLALLVSISISSSARAEYFKAPPTCEVSGIVKSVTPDDDKKAVELNITSEKVVVKNEEDPTWKCGYKEQKEFTFMLLPNEYETLKKGNTISIQIEETGSVRSIQWLKILKK